MCSGYVMRIIDGRGIGNRDYQAIRIDLVLLDLSLLGIMQGLVIR